jgi:hypothetical protein
MLCGRIWTESVPRAELDDRARDSRLRFERLQRLFLPVAETAPAGIIRFSRPGGGSRSGRTPAPVSERLPAGARKAEGIRVRQSRPA